MWSFTPEHCLPFCRFSGGTGARWLSALFPGGPQSAAEKQANCHTAGVGAALLCRLPLRVSLHRRRWRPVCAAPSSCRSRSSVLLCCFGLPRGRRGRKRILTRFPLPDAMSIGCAQALALFPGTSRSGITIATGLFLGLTREAAARFSFLAFGSYHCWRRSQETARSVGSGNPGCRPDCRCCLGFCRHCLIGYLTIKFLMRYLQRNTLLIFICLPSRSGSCHPGVHSICRVPAMNILVPTKHPRANEAVGLVLFTLTISCC